MNPLFAQLALTWLEAEIAANPDEFPINENRDMSEWMGVAIDRVYAVLSGDVRWKDASPGDAAIWKSRITEVPTFVQSWKRTGKPNVPGAEKIKQALQRARPNDDPFNQTTPRPAGSSRLLMVRTHAWWSFFDTWEDVGRKARNPGRRTVILFDNTNIGNMWLSNLQVSGQLGSDETFVVCSVHACVSSIEGLAWASDRLLVDFRVGDRPALPRLHLRDLFRGIDLTGADKRVVVIGQRQNFAAQCVLRDVPPSDLASFDVSLHIEGLLTTDRF